MKKTLSIILVLAFVLSMCTFTFVSAEEAEKEILPGLINQVGDWSAVEGGYEAKSNGMILLDQQMNAGVLEVTVTPGSTFKTEVNVFVKASGFDTLTAANLAQQRNLTAGYQACLYGSQASPKNCIGFYNHYSNGWKGGPNIDGATGGDFTKFPYDTFVGGADGFANPSFKIRIEFGSGGVRVLVDGKVVVDNVYPVDKQATTTNTEIKTPTGTQIAIMADDDTFTNFKFSPWDASNDAAWTSDCDSITNTTAHNGFAYNGNVSAPEGSVLSFDVTAASFKEGTGNNGFFFGGDHLYGVNNAEKNSAVGKGMNYWMVYFNNNNTAAVKVINANWDGRVDGLKVIDFASIIPENAEEVTINVTATYTGRSATITFKCGDKSVTESYTLADDAKTAAGNDVIAPNGSEVAFRSWGGSAMTFGNIKVDGKAIDGHATDMDGVCQKCGWDTTMFANVLGDWSAVEGGVKANSSGLIVFNEQMKAGVFETTVTKGATFGNEISIFVNGSGFDVLESLADQRAKTASYQTMFYGAVKCIGFYNHYSNGWKGGAGLDGATGGDFTRFPYDTYVGGADGFANPSFKIRIEFGSGGVRVLVDGKVVVDNVYPVDKQATTTNTEIKTPTGTQIAIMADDDTFTNFKFSPWDASNDAAWTSDCDSITNTTAHNGFAYNGNVSAPEGSVLSFDVTAKSFKEGTGNNGFFFGGDHLYGVNNPEKTAAIGKGMNYWMIYFNNNNTMQIWVINGHWNGRYGLPAADFSSIIPENPGSSITINVNAVYSGRTLTLVLSCGDKSTTIERTIAEDAVRADNGAVIAPNGSEVAFRSWNSGSAMTFGNIKVDGKAINEHVLTKVDAVKETCTENGNVAYYKCEKCGKNYANADGTDLIADVVIPAHHTMTYHAEEPETCTATGIREYWSCSACGYNYDSENGGNVLSDEELIIPAHEHTMTNVSSVGESCTEAGNVEYWTCSECKKNYDANGGVIADVTVAPHAHSMTHHAEEPSTCIATGVKEHWSCSECGFNYDSENGGNVLSDEDLVIPKKDHVMTYHAASGNTCLERGSVEHWACSECGYNYDAEQGGNIIQNVETEATGHNMTHFEAIAPDCITDGNVEYWHCENCGNNYADDAKDSENELDSVIDPKLGHDMIHNDRVAPTCTEPGTKEFWTCKNCNKNFADKDGNEVIVNLGISALGHDLIHHESTSTCMEAGNGEYWECSECGLLFADEDAEQEINEIPAGEINDNHVNTIDDATVGHDEYSHWYECECGDILDTNEHDEAGTHGECSVCGYKAPAADTGDMTAIIAIVAIVAALGCGVVFTVSKKRI